MMLSIGLYCSNENNVNIESERSMFYLDGSLGETTKALRLAGFLDAELFTANIFENTANSLKVIKRIRMNAHPTIFLMSLLSASPSLYTSMQNEHRVRTYHGRAHDSLLSDFVDIPFCSYYLDGCSGSSQSIVDIIDSIFTEARCRPQRLSSQLRDHAAMPMQTDDDNYKTEVKLEAIMDSDSLPSPKHSLTVRENQHEERTSEWKHLNCFSIGFTLTNAGGHDSRSLVDREQEVTKCICSSGRKYGYAMNYVGDNPGMYGLESSPIKRDGDVQTTWVVLSR